MIAALLASLSAQADGCYPTLQSLQIATEGTTTITLRLNHTHHAVRLLLLDLPTVHGLSEEAIGVRSFAGLTPRGEPFLKVLRDGEPVLDVMPADLEAGWIGGDAERLRGIEPVVAAMVYESMEHVGSELTPLGLVVLDWMTMLCAP